ncbi:MAG: MFS transporter [Capsulimonadaceae bacterium]
MAIGKASIPAERGDDPALRRDWMLFTALTFLFSFGFAVYNGVFQNFLRDVHHAGPIQLGGLESTREIPGLLAALTAGSLVALAETRIATLGLAVTAIGMAATGYMPRYSAVVFVTVLWSVGFHLWTTVSPAMTLSLGRGREGGRHLGRMSGVGATATMGALGFTWLLDRLLPHLPYRFFFALAGGSILIATALCARLSPSPAPAKRRARWILRREYGLFYLLTFLEGCRRQIFSIFASFALILVYHVPLSSMLLLQFINAIMISISAPAMGRQIDRRGEKGPLRFYSIGLIVVFLGYALVRNVYGLYALFLLDNVLFSFGVGYTTYLHRIVREGELTPCLAMGVTMNHVAAVTVPIGGALLWQHSGNYQLPFWVGVALACVALAANRWLPEGVAPARQAIR